MSFVDLEATAPEIFVCFVWVSLLILMFSYMPEF